MSEPVSPEYFYNLLIDYASSTKPIDRLGMGQVWTVCQVASGTGLAMTPSQATRTLPWAGTLKGQPLSAIVPWIKSWNFHEATVGLAAINAGLSLLPAPPTTPIPVVSGKNNLAVFEHFLPQLKDKKVVVIGRYPGLEQYQDYCQLDVIEKNPTNNDYPDNACEFLIPAADWVFITASSIVNKSFPRLAELAADTTSVLMGPSTPLFPELFHYGIDYIAPTKVVSNEALWDTAIEGGGVRIFETGVEYQLLQLTPQVTSDWTKRLIRQTINEKERLKAEMETWYGAGNTTRFPGYKQLEFVNSRLSRLDTCFKILWDKYPGQLTDKL